MSYYGNYGSSTSAWLAAAAAMGAGFGFAPVFPMHEPPLTDAQLRRRQSYEDLLHAAEERDRREQGDQFNRQVGQENREAPVKKRSKAKRALDKVLVALHLKKKPQPAPVNAPVVVNGRSQDQDTRSISPLSSTSSFNLSEDSEHSSQSQQQPLLPRRQVRFALDENRPDTLRRQHTVADLLNHFPEVVLVEPDHRPVSVQEVIERTGEPVFEAQTAEIITPPQH